MMSRILGMTLLLAWANAAGVCAQSAPTTVAPAASSPSTPATEPAPKDTAIDPTKLGISFERVKMQLAEKPPTQTLGLKIHEQVEVVAPAPKPLLWNPQTAALTSAAVPYGAPTQKDIMKLIVPKEFQSPAMDLNALMLWLMQHLNKKSDE